jgi:predicted component of type VI protein secretion system
MAKVFILTGPDVGHECDVTDGLVVGRSDDCGLHLRDASISRHHARFARTAAGFEIVDLDSRNGLTLNGVRVGRIPLKNGAEFLLGSVRVRFKESGGDAVDEIELEAGPAGDVASGASTTLAAAPGRVPQQPAAEAGAARRRAIATREGILQFERIEGRDASVLNDDVGQQSAPMKFLIFLAVLAVAAGLFWGAMKIAGQFTPERATGTTNESTAEPK